MFMQHSGKLTNVAIEHGPFEDVLNNGDIPASYVSFAEGSPFWCFVYFSLLNVNLAGKTAWFSKIGPLKRWLTI